MLHSLGAEGCAEALSEHRRLIREAWDAEGGVEVDTQGDAFFFAFPTAPGTLAATAALIPGVTGCAPDAQPDLRVTPEVAGSVPSLRLSN